MTIIKYSDFNSSIGRIILVGDEQGLTRLLIDNNTKTIEMDKAWQRDDALFANAREQLTEYLAGKRYKFSLALNPTGTDFQKQCWDALCAIPYGEKRTYGEQAKTIGNPKAVRAVGLANNRNPIPIIIPCHRVVGADGKLTGYAYGLALKQQLLDLEQA